MQPVVEIEEPPTNSLRAWGKARCTIGGAPLSFDELRGTDAYWRACKYLALGMIYLQANCWLRSEPESLYQTMAATAINPHLQRKGPARNYRFVKEIEP